MEATHIIREAVQRVTYLRQLAAKNPALATAIGEVKHFQAARFSGTYADFLNTEKYKTVALFFLEELYSAKDYTERDAQFAKIASALERLFPEQVVKTAVCLAQLHELTEELDLAMAQQWMSAPLAPPIARYVSAWRAVDRRPDRNRQLSTVMTVGHELDHLTRTPGLRRLLKMMRGPARLAGLGSLQRFLESGFDTFASMGASGEGAVYFLDAVYLRESGLINRLFDADRVACETEISATLGEPR
jgi:hypothetical protein